LIGATSLTADGLAVYAVYKAFNDIFDKSAPEVISSLSAYLRKKTEI